MKDQKRLLVIDTGHAPENITAEVDRFRPDRVLFVDAADMGELPGTIRWIAVDEIDGMTASTHTLTISMLADYLNLSLNCSSMLLGIQPLSNEVGDITSRQVSAAINAIVQELTALSWSSPAP